MDKFCVEGLTGHSNIKGNDETTKEIFHDSIREIYEDLFGETIEHSKEVQKKNGHKSRGLMKERLWMCFEVDREARKQLYRSLVNLEKYDHRGNILHVLKLFIKNAVIKPIKNIVNNISYYMWYNLKAVAKYWFFLAVTKPVLKFKFKLSIMMPSITKYLNRHLINKYLRKLEHTVALQEQRFKSIFN